MNLLEDNDGKEIELKVNQKFAKSYEKKKDRAALAAAKKADLLDSDESSSEEEEDENGELLTPEVDSKIMDTLLKIRNKDPSIYDSNQKFFTDDLFEEKKTSKTKPVKYQDFLRTTLLEEGADAFEKAEEAAKRKKGTEQEDVRTALLQAVKDGGDDEDDLFVKKVKSKGEKIAEDQDFDDFDKKTNMDHMQILASKYWQSDDQLDSDEQFLRDYILHEQWKDTNGIQNGVEDHDSESEHLEAVDNFEHDYNFRFEEAGGDQYTGHDRNVLNSVRQKDDKRKKKRKEREERKLEEKLERVEELKKLKDIKKKEIEARLQTLREVTGKDVEVELDAEFDPEAHDDAMNKMLGENYDDLEETLDGAAVRAKCYEADVKGGIDDENSENEVVWDEETWWEEKEEDDTPAETKEEVETNEGEDIDETEPEHEDDLWFLCDACDKAILPGKPVFECNTCENFALCKSCFKGRIHPPHKFKKSKVPGKCLPPTEWEKTKDDNELPTEIQQEMEKISDELLQEDYEDIIGGDLPTRFKYATVPKRSYGLTAKQILEMSDKELNQIVGIKKLTRPYGDSASRAQVEDEERIAKRTIDAKLRKRRFEKRQDKETYWKPVVAEPTEETIRARKKKRRHREEEANKASADATSSSVNEKDHGNEDTSNKKKRVKNDNGEQQIDGDIPKKKKIKTNRTEKSKENDIDGPENKKKKERTEEEKEEYKKMKKKAKKVLDSNRSAAYGI